MSTNHDDATENGGTSKREEHQLEDGFVLVIERPGFGYLYHPDAPIELFLTGQSFRGSAWVVNGSKGVYRIPAPYKILQGAPPISVQALIRIGEILAPGVRFEEGDAEDLRSVVLGASLLQLKVLQMTINAHNRPAEEREKAEARAREITEELAEKLGFDEARVELAMKLAEAVGRDQSAKEVLASVETIFAA